MSEININLNKLPGYKNTKCVRCERRYPDTILNIEGHIHHKEPYRCLNLKECQRIVRRIK